MDLIVTHTNADFDALASLVAAGKLYPGAALMLPGSPEAMVRDYLEIYQAKLGIQTEKQCRLENVRCLVIVDTRQPNRIGKASALVGQPGITIDIYDHHPYTSTDIKADRDLSKKTGAATTILVELIRKRRIKITPAEASLMALGIYEDTGSLTFGGTSKSDIDAVSYLLSCGAELNEVSFYLHKELSAAEVLLLTQLIHKTRLHDINGVRVAMTACRVDGYVGELSLLTHRLLDLENFNVLFVLAGYGARVQVIARSRLDSVDVGAILAHFGGGGHSRAASGVIKNTDLDKACQELLRVLSAEIKPLFTAEDIMIAPPKEVLNTDSVDEVKKIMVRSGQNCLPVLEDKKIKGIITRTDVDKAGHHGFGNQEVAKYMSTDFRTVTAKTPFSRLREIIFEEDLSLIPVLSNKKMVGVVTRTDFLRYYHQNLDKYRYDNRIFAEEDVSKRPAVRSTASDEEEVRQTLSEGSLSSRDMKSKLQASLPGRVMSILKTLGQEADKRNLQAFVVGGFVRDLLLGVKNYDIDIVIEGDAIDFTRQIAGLFRAKIVTHKKFGTALLVLEEGFKIDFASARTEYYEYPAALPTVEYSSIKHDLFRRDFTINAMAVKINSHDFGRLIDFFRGQRDLKTGRIKVLHNLSFVEDPTRIFRAVRFEQRYNFTIDRHTEYLIKTALSLEMFEKVEAQRLRDEIILILNEERPLKSIMRMNQLHELRFIHAHLKLGKKPMRALRALEDVMAWFKVMFPAEKVDTWLVYFSLLCGGLSSEEIEQVCGRFVFSERDRRVMLKTNEELTQSLRFLNRAVRLKPSRIYEILHKYPLEVLLAGLAKAETMRIHKMIADYITTYSKVKLKITGQDLKKIGLKPGPDFRHILKSVLLKKIDGKIHTRKEEFEAAQRVKGR